jgi:hypothetical protein
VSLNAVRWALYEAPVAILADRVVLVCLADHASQDGGGNIPSAANVARKLGMGLGAVERSLARLAEDGAVRLSDGPHPAVVGLNLEVKK